MAKGGGSPVGACMLAGALLCWGAASCGDEPAPGAEEQVAATIDELRQSFAAGRFADVCAGLTPQGRKAVPGARESASCASSLRRALPADRRSASRWRSGRREVEQVRIAGSRATATVAFTSRIPGKVELVSRTGGWRLADVRVTPLPSRSTLAIARRAGEDLAVWSAPTAKRVRCPPVTRVATTGDAAVDGGCVLRVSSDGAAPLVVSTLFGDYEVARCRGSYRLHVLPPYQVLADYIVFDGPGPCRDVARCRDGETGLTYPWQGQRLAGPHGTSAIRIDLCINTPVGRVRGLQMLALEDRGGDARLRPYDHPAGESSVQLLGTWDVRPDDIRVGGPRRPPRSGG